MPSTWKTAEAAGAANQIQIFEEWIGTDAAEPFVDGAAEKDAGIASSQAEAAEPGQTGEAAGAGVLPSGSESEVAAGDA